MKTISNVNKRKHQENKKEVKKTQEDQKVENKGKNCFEILNN